MNRETERFINILKSSNSGCKEDCATCEKYNDISKCENMVLATKLINAGAAIPILCKQCGNYMPEAHMCKIRKNSWGGPLSRGPHDYCSDGTPKELSELKE